MNGVHSQSLAENQVAEAVANHYAVFEPDLRELFPCFETHSHRRLSVKRLLLCQSRAVKHLVEPSSRANNLIFHIKRNILKVFFAHQGLSYALLIGYNDYGVKQSCKYAEGFKHSVNELELFDALNVASDFSGVAYSVFIQEQGLCIGYRSHSSLSFCPNNFSSTIWQMICPAIMWLS